MYLWGISNKKLQALTQEMHAIYGGMPRTEEERQESRRRVERTREQALRQARGYMKGGAVAAVIGGVITGVTYSLAEPGGTYILAYGALFGGILLFLIGLYLTSKVRTGDDATTSDASPEEPPAEGSEVDG